MIASRGETNRTANPIALFQAWLDDARRAGAREPTAMALATVDGSGAPNVRMVLLKAADERGFVFYTNLDSPKAAELRALPVAALCFYWPEIERQVRIRGRVAPVTAEEADTYFATRPRFSQIGAWASRQSQPMKSPLELLRACAAIALRHVATTVPRPAFWSGFRVEPDQMEFWSACPYRLHERELFTRTNSGWETRRLFP